MSTNQAVPAGVTDPVRQRPLVATPISKRIPEREKRRMYIPIANPQPRADGVVYDRISVYHANRIERQGHGFIADGQLVLGPRDLVDAGERVLLRGRPDFRTMFRDLPPPPNFELLPVIPRYSGRSTEDFLEAAGRNKPKEPQHE